MASNDTTVKLDRVNKSFGEFTAVRELSLDVRAGRVFGLLGPNGAGKTTTIRMIVNITAPDSGSISLFGRKIDAQVQDRIGYLPEERGLYRRMRIVDQLRFFWGDPELFYIFQMWDIGMDNVAINAVPEPGTLAALGFGMAALLLRRRK